MLIGFVLIILPQCVCVLLTLRSGSEDIYAVSIIKLWKACIIFKGHFKRFLFQIRFVLFLAFLWCIKQAPKAFFRQVFFFMLVFLRKNLRFIRSVEFVLPWLYDRAIWGSPKNKYYKLSHLATYLFILVIRVNMQDISLKYWLHSPTRTVCVRAHMRACHPPVTAANGG